MTLRKGKLSLSIRQNSKVQHRTLHGKKQYFTGSWPRFIRLWNSLPIEVVEDHYLRHLKLDWMRHYQE